MFNQVLERDNQRRGSHLKETKSISRFIWFITPLALSFKYMIYHSQTGLLYFCIQTKESLCSLFLVLHVLHGRRKGLQQRTNIQ